MGRAFLKNPRHHIFIPTQAHRAFVAEVAHHALKTFRAAVDHDDFPAHRLAHWRA